ncbi:MAG: hypothetical protein IRY83_01835 [Chloroflexi bacterium]|nr:hypothetical protein [Chloroflexota bacterium]
MRRLFAVLVALALVMPALPAAASNELQVTVRPGFDGMVRPGSWAPIDILLANAGPNLSGSVEISVLGRPAGQGSIGPEQSLDYSVPVTLPQHSSKHFSTAVYVPPFFDRLQVRLISRGVVIYQQSVPLQRLDPTQIVCGTLSTDQTAFDSLNGLSIGDVQRQPRIVHLDLPDLPTNPQLLSSLDCLIISDYATRGLSPLQQSALTSWVNDGGILTIGTGPNGASTLDGLPPALLPARLDGTTPLRSLSGLASYVGVPNEPGGPWLVGNLKVTDGVVVAADESQPVLVVGKRGRGAVFMLALSLTQRPLRGWNGMDRLWASILSYSRVPESTFASYFRQEVGWGRLPREVLIRSASASSPETRRLLLGLILFALVAGPVNYLVLSRLKRRELALVTVPVLAGLATAGALAYANRYRQGDVIVNQVSIIQSWDGSGTGLLHSFVGVFGLHPQRYQLNVPANSLVASPSLSYGLRGQYDRLASVPRVVGGGQPQIQGIQLEPGALASFTLDGHARDPGSVRSGLVLEGDHIAGQVTNNLSFTLYDAAIIAGGSVQRIGDLRPGGSAAVNLRLGGGSPVGSQDDSLVVSRLFPGQVRNARGPHDPKFDILNAALNPWQSYGGHIELSSLSLIGWIDDAIDPASDPETGKPAHQYTLYVTSLPLLMPAGMQVIPEVLLDRQDLTSNYNARIDSSGIQVNAGDSVGFQYTSPVDPSRFSVRSLTLVTATTSPVSGALQVYDWRTASWDDVPFAVGNLAIPNPDRFFSATGLVRLRFQNRATAAPGTAPVKFTRFQLLIGGVGR